MNDASSTSQSWHVQTQSSFQELGIDYSRRSNSTSEQGGRSLTYFSSLIIIGTRGRHRITARTDCGRFRLTWLGWLLLRCSTAVAIGEV
ncbi:unnamed protein product [Allacma fusca]|uniref:Uncharacterized protein n=1 Tax=Allacma fusca TaxID=39272 RepID=A0A8J2KKL6_9HEXA|nr:unnamed protein product [Allacma fusca]